MGLSERKEKIIQAVVNSYIESCEPVSSADIRDNYLPTLSSATIRNELAALEEMGYLEQPHTSAGRIPTADAYKLYVDKLMPRKELSDEELGLIKKYFDKKITEIDEVLRNTAKVISEITHLTGVAYIENVQDAVIKSVKLVKITDHDALVIIVTSMGVLKDATLTVQGEVCEDYFNSASEFMSTAFFGHTIREASDYDKLVNDIKREYEMIFATIIQILKDYANSSSKEVMLEGGSKLLDQPEYSNITKAKAMMAMLESKEKLYPELSSNGESEVSIDIKQEDTEEGKPECAIVTASLKTHGVNIGKAGVIGPIRMDYSKILTVLSYIGKAISEMPVGVKDKDKE